jgi:hypothetical protein
MTPLTTQRLIALPFLILGAWCLFWPGFVEQLVFQPAYRHLSATSALMIGCFGAQAMLAGLFAATSRFTRLTFAAYGAALIPFFGFNYWFVFVEPMFNGWMALDFGANAAMLVLCFVGWRAAR